MKCVRCGNTELEIEFDATIAYPADDPSAEPRIVVLGELIRITCDECGLMSDDYDVTEEESLKLDEQHSQVDGGNWS